MPPIPYSAHMPKRPGIKLTVRDEASAQEVTISIKRSRWDEVKKLLETDIKENLDPIIKKLLAEKFSVLMTGRAPKVEKKTKGRS